MWVGWVGGGEARIAEDGTCLFAPPRQRSNAWGEAYGGMIEAFGAAMGALQCNDSICIG